MTESTTVAGEQATLPRSRMPIAEAAARTGLSIDTLRYYEKVGLAEPPARDSGGRRVYTEDDVGWLTFVTRLRATGMPIRKIQEYAELRHDGDASAPRRKAILLEHRETIRDQVSALTESLVMLDWKIEHYSKVEEAIASGAVADGCCGPPEVS